MNNLHTREEVESALLELGRQLALRDADHVTVLCCGAAALCALGILSRRTLDVDAIGLVGQKGEIVAIEKFSPEMLEAIAATGRKMQLLPDWFNPAATTVLARGLPVGCLERSALHSKVFGPCLTVRFMDRIDLIALKMYAALDPQEGKRHAEDLREVQPTMAELRHGVQWMSAWPSSQAFKKALHRLLEAFDAVDLLI